MKVFSKAGARSLSLRVPGIVAAAVAAVALVACSTASPTSSPTTANASTPAAPASDQVRSYAGTQPAPPFPTDVDWLNTPAPLTLKDLRGKVVLLDFWTYGCINCMHDIPWLLKIEKDFPDTLAVIGVHSAKFTESGNTKNIREVILRYGLNYPVVNDYKFQIWNEYGVNAWPTLVLIDPAGNIVGAHEGEGFYPIFKPIISSLVAEFSKKGMIDRRPLKLKLEKQGLPQTVLAFPGKVYVDGARNRMFIADTAHNRIVEATLSDGQVVASIGSGTRGYKNGSFADAELNQPYGMALSPGGNTLYVADTGNHAIRSVDLKSQEVTTLVGTGQQAAAYPPAPGTAPNVALSSPWALALRDNELYIAMAGSHQIWRMNLKTKQVAPFAGSGYEGASDGPRMEASLAQPSALSFNADGSRLYFANSEGSEIRYIDMKKGTVVTLAGATDSLFDFGNKNGIGTAARFQHPLGVAAYDGKVYVADTYNSEIRVIDPATGAVSTLAGSTAGWRDGKNPLFYEPGGLFAAGGKLYIADTNNNSVRILDLATGETSTFVLKGLSLLSGPSDVYATKEVHLSPITVAPGSGSVRLEVTFPKGYEPNAQAPSDITLSTSGGQAIQLAGTAKFSKADPHFPLEFPATFTAGTTDLTVDLSVVYCKTVEASVCLIHQARLVVPVTVAPGGGAPSNVTVSYSVEQ